MAENKRKAALNMDVVARFQTRAQINNGESLFIAITHDGTIAAAGGVQGTIDLFEPLTGRPLDRIETFDQRSYDCRGTLSKTGDLLAAADHEIRIFPLRAGKRDGPPRVLPDPLSSRGALAFAPDGRTLAAVGDGIRLYDINAGITPLWRSGHGRIMRKLAWGDMNDPDWRDTEFDTTIRGVAFSPDGTRLATGADDYTLRIWDVATGKEVDRLEGHESGNDLHGGVEHIAFSPDGTRIASSADDRTIRFWHATPGPDNRCSATLREQPFVNALAFSPDGTFLVSSTGPIISLWHAPTGRPAGTFEGHRRARSTSHDTVAGIAFLPDGRTVASIDDGGRVLVWKLKAC